VASVVGVVSPGSSWVLLYVLFVTYHGTLLWLTGQTVGKSLFGLEVRRVVHGATDPGEEGVTGETDSDSREGSCLQGPRRFADLAWAMGRTGFGYPVVDVLGLGTLLALVTPGRQALHDLVFASQVVQTTEEAVTARRMLERLIEFAERQRAALEEQRKAYVLVRGLWKALLATAFGAKKLLDWLQSAFTSSAATTAQSTATSLTATATATVSVAAMVVTAIAIATVGGGDQPSQSDRWSMRAGGERLVVDSGDGIEGLWTGDWGDFYMESRGEETRAAYTCCGTGALILHLEEDGVWRGWFKDSTGTGRAEFRRMQDGSLDGRWRFEDQGTWNENWDLEPVVHGDIPEALVGRLQDDAFYTDVWKQS
jgi:ribosomal protein L17